MSDGVSPCFGGENGPLAKLQGCGSGVGLEICGWAVSPTYDLLHGEMNIQLPTNYFDVKTRGSEDFEGWILPTTSLVLSIPFLVAGYILWVRNLQIRKPWKTQSHQPFPILLQKGRLLIAIRRLGSCGKRFVTSPICLGKVPTSRFSLP